MIDRVEDDGEEVKVTEVGVRMRERGNGEIAKFWQGLHTSGRPLWKLQQALPRPRSIYGFPAPSPVLASLPDLHSVLP